MGGGVNTSGSSQLLLFLDFVMELVTAKRDHANPIGASAPSLYKTL
jgi:hypothetical protein